MALYSVNKDLPGAKKVTISEPVAVVASSSFTPLIVLPLDPGNMQSHFDGYVTLSANTSTTQAVFSAPVAVADGELAGQYLWVSGLSEVRQITGNSAADALASCTVTVSIAFSSAPTGGTADVRLWENWSLPSLHTSLSDFASKFINTDASGDFVWTNQINALEAIQEYKNAGGGLFYVLPVPTSTDSTAELSGNLESVWTDSTFTTRALLVSPQFDLIVVPKSPSLPVTLSGTEWASVDTAVATYITNRATDSTADDDLRELRYVADSHTGANASSITYKDTTWAPTSFRVGFWHGQYLISDFQNRGQLKATSLGPAVAGLINRVSNSAPQSYGHAVEGRNYTQLVNRGLVEDLTPANRLSLMSGGINPLITKPALGSWLESSWTVKKTSSTRGEDPLERLQVSLTQAKIWNQAVNVLNSVVAEPNVPVVRGSVVSRLTSQLSALLQQQIIVDYTVSDVTTDSDVNSGTARFELSFKSAPEIDFVELKLVAQLGQGE